jgi:hypothetical protein
MAQIIKRNIRAIRALSAQSAVPCGSLYIRGIRALMLGGILPIKKRDGAASLFHHAHDLWGSLAQRRLSSTFCAAKRGFFAPD